MCYLLGDWALECLFAKRQMHNIKHQFDYFMSGVYFPGCDTYWFWNISTKASLPATDYLAPVDQTIAPKPTERNMLSYFLHEQCRRVKKQGGVGGLLAASLA